MDDSRWDRPGLDGESQQARGIRRNLQLDETVREGERKAVAVAAVVAAVVFLLLLRVPVWGLLCCCWLLFGHVVVAVGARCGEMAWAGEPLSAV
jgi:hypothetical protein